MKVSRTRFKTPQNEDDSLEDHIESFENDYGLSEDDTYPSKGDTRVIARPLVRRIGVHYGNSTPFYASHIAYRKAAFPDETSDEEQTD